MSYENIPLPDELGRRLKQGFSLRAAPRTLGELARAEYEPGAECSPAFLISEKPTRHQVRFGDEVLYTHCVIDTFVLPSLRGEAAEITSLDPVTGQELRFRLSPQGLEGGDEALSQAVVSVGASVGGVGSAHASCCPFINLFTTHRHYEEWGEQHPEAVAVAVPFKDAVALAQDWLLSPPAKSCCQ